MLTASSLYAKTQGVVQNGEERCHWCGCPCARKILHGGPPPIPFIRSSGSAKIPSSPYQCHACWLYNRKRITLTSLQGKQFDKQCLVDHSWFMTEDEIHIITKEDYSHLYSILLFPPLIYSLSIHNGRENLIQLACVNSNQGIQANTVLHYTFNNIYCTYTIYELEEALRHGYDGKQPGVRMLIDFLGPYQIPGDVTEKREAGRPKRKEDSDGKNVIRKIK